jgi:uncharacterized Zn-finger protein
MSTAQAVQSSETSEILATSSVVACDGGGGALGHPKVFLTFNNTDHLTCPYCSQSFRLAPGTKLGHGH